MTPLPSRVERKGMSGSGGVALPGVGASPENTRRAKVPLSVMSLMLLPSPGTEISVCLSCHRTIVESTTVVCGAWIYMFVTFAC